MKSSAREDIPKKKLKRFNSKVLRSQTTIEFSNNAASLSIRRQRYHERRTRADTLHQQTSRLELANSAVTILVIFCAFADDELKYYDKESELQSAALRVLIICASCLQIILTVAGAQRQLDLLKVLGFIHPQSKDSSASLLYHSPFLLSCEVVHLCIVMPPSWRYDDTMSQWQDIVTFAIVLRIYHVVRFVYSQSPLFLPKAQFFTYTPRRQLHGIYHDVTFVILTQMNTEPFFTLFLAGATALAIGGLLFHLVERQSYPTLTIYDGPWVIAITQLTVGYGEITPKTDVGRLVSIGPGMLGVCTVSLVVAYSLRMLKMSRPQKKLTEQLYHSSYVRKHLLTLCAVFLQRWWRLKLSRRVKDPQRLRKMLDLKLIHGKFKQKFAMDLAGPSPEFDSQLLMLENRMHKSFVGIKNKLTRLREMNKLAGKLSTAKFAQVSKVLQCKHSYLKLKWIGIETHTRWRTCVPHQSSFRKKQNRRSSIVEKKASDGAVRRMLLARISILRVSSALASEISEESIPSHSSSHNLP